MRSVASLGGAGLHPPPAGYERFRARRLQHGYAIIDRRVARLCPDLQVPRHELARICGQGYLVGAELHAQLCANGADRFQVAETCALINVLVAYFEAVIDRHGSLVPQLRARLNEAGLDEALRLERPEDPGVFPDVRGDHPLVAFVVRVADELFRSCRELGRRSGKDGVWRRFRAAVLDAYAAGTAIPEQELDSPPHAGALDVLRKKSELPAVMMGLVVSLSRNARPTADPERVTVLLEKVGRLFRLVDDVVDLPDDIASRHWNTILLEYRAPFSPREIRRMDAGSAVAALVDDGIVAQAVEGLGVRLAEIELAAGGLVADAPGFLSKLRLWAAGWLLSFCSRRERVGHSSVKALEAGLGFLARHQHEDGGFRTDLARRGSPGIVATVPSVYLHSLISYALRVMPSGEVSRRIRDRAQAYLRRLRENDGWWRFHGADGGAPGPDVDDTAVALAALLADRANGTEERADAIGWLSTLETLRTEGGLYKTWADPGSNAAGFELPDAAVNANLLLVQALTGSPDERLVEFFSRTIRTRSFEYLNLYGVAPFSVPFLVSRAYGAGVAGLRPDIDVLRQFVLEAGRPDATWGNDLDTAMALVTLANTGCRGDEITAGLEALLSRQGDDGGWGRGMCFRDLHGNQYGSRCYTTALCLEVIARTTG